MRSYWFEQQRGLSRATISGGRSARVLQTEACLNCSCLKRAAVFSQIRDCPRTFAERFLLSQELGRLAYFPQAKFVRDLSLICLSAIRLFPRSDHKRALAGGEDRQRGRDRSASARRSRCCRCNATNFPELPLEETPPRIRPALRESHGAMASFRRNRKNAFRGAAKQNQRKETAGRSRTMERTTLPILCMRVWSVSREIARNGGCGPYRAASFRAMAALAVSVIRNVPKCGSISSSRHIPSEAET